MVAEDEIATGGHNINPVVVDPHDVRFAMDYCPGASGYPGAGSNLYRNKAGIVFTGGFLLFHNGETTAGGEYIGINQINPLLTYPLEQSPQNGCLKDVGIIIGNLAFIFNLDSIGLSLSQLADQPAQCGSNLDKGCQSR